MSLLLFHQVHCRETIATEKQPCSSSHNFINLSTLAAMSFCVGRGGLFMHVVEL